MNKRGISKIIVVIFMILLALSVIVLLYNVVKKLLIEETEAGEAKVELMTERMSIEDVLGDGAGNFVNPSEVNITIQKGPSKIPFSNITIIESRRVEVDVFSVVDLSGSMSWRCYDVPDWSCCGPDYAVCASREINCTDCGGTWGERYIYHAKEANKDFIDSVLNYSGNKMGLVGYEQIANEDDYHELSQDTESLKDKVDDWETGGGTCICCGINKAVEKFNLESSADRTKLIVVMSDGEATVKCPGEVGDLDGDGVSNHFVDHAINASLDAYETYNITVHAIGFGPGVAGIGENALKNISYYGGGEYYYADTSELGKIYEEVSSKIIEQSGVEQKISHLKVIFYNETASHEEQIPFSELPGPLETKTFTIPLDEGDLSEHITNIIRIEIYLVIVTESGRQIIGPVLDVWEVG